MIGFLTGISEVNPGTTMGVVYLPTAPTPNSGWVAMIPIQQIYDTSMSVSEAMTMVLSGGISSPWELRLRQWTRRRPRLSSRKGAGPATQQFNENSGVFNLPGIRQQQDSDQR